jgi:hypothetical protein
VEPGEELPSRFDRVPEVVQEASEKGVVGDVRGQWENFLDSHVPVVDAPSGKRLEGRSLTTAERKRAALRRLYDHDERVAPWAWTAHGVLQAVNTYEHHEGVVRGASRPERNMLRAVSGDFGKLDRAAFRTLASVLA